MIAVVFVATVVAWFGFTAVVSGEFNYQGGDRKTFYTSFPFDGPTATSGTGAASRVSTDARTAGSVLEPATCLARFAHNVEYFLVGRHFGFVPYFFPGVVAIGSVAVLARAPRLWRLLLVPGRRRLGGGPAAARARTPGAAEAGRPGNRYFLSIYPALFFLTPPLMSAWPGLLAWLGGALFTAKMLLNPFVAAKFPYQTTERGFARRLPVELTMANDLPIMLNAGPRVARRGSRRCCCTSSTSTPTHPEPRGGTGLWVAGDGRADIVVRSDWPIGHAADDRRVADRHDVHRVGRRPDVTVPLEPGRAGTFDRPGRPASATCSSYAYLLSARSSEVSSPHLQDPASTGLPQSRRRRCAFTADAGRRAVSGAHTATLHRPSWRAAALVAARALLATVVLTWPLAFRMGHVGRVNNGDGQFSIWNVAWVARTLVVDPLHVFDANIFYPAPLDARVFGEQPRRRRAGHPGVLGHDGTRTPRTTSSCSWRSC